MVDVTTPAGPLTVRSRRFFEGRSAGLGEHTAVVEIDVGAALSDLDTAAVERIRAGILRLGPQDPLPHVGRSDWPSAFLEPGTDDPAGPAEQLGRWAVAVTVAIQRWGRDPVWRGRVVQSDMQADAATGRLVLAIPWWRRTFFDEALRLSLDLLSEWVWPGARSSPAPIVSNHFGSRWRSIQASGLAPITLRFIQAAVARGMPFEVLPSCVQIGWGANAERFDLSFTGASSWMGSSVARNKGKSNRYFGSHAIPVAASRLVGDITQAQQAVTELGWPVVVKPLTSDGGHGVTAGITDVDTLAWALEQATKRVPGNVLLERHVPGDDYRLLVVHDRLISAIRCTPGAVADVTAAVHPVNAALARRVARLVGLDIVGIDLISPDIARPWNEVGAVVSEVNAQPRLSLHWPADPERDLEGEILDRLFLHRSARIPTAAVSGGEHAGASAELLQQVWTAVGTPAGVCTTRMLRIGTEIYSTDDLAGTVGVRAILIDPAMRAAAFELPPGRVAQQGHPCDRYGVAGVFGVQDGGAEADVAERAHDVVVLNADDPACLALRSRARAARHILVAADSGNTAVAEHVRAGGEAVTVDGRGRIVALAGAVETPLLPAPGDRATLFAAALAWAHGIGAAAIGRALGTGTS